MTRNEPAGADEVMDAGGYGPRLLASLRRRGLRPVGERSCKMREGVLLTDRFLLGIPVSELSLGSFLELLTDFGMPPAGQALFRQHLAGASEIQFAVERETGQTLCKVYLEYWQTVVERVRQGRTGPVLLNLGLKWQAGHRDGIVLDRYICHPRLSHRTIIERLEQRQGALAAEAAALVGAATAAVADRSLIYLEVDDDGGERHSYDINLYPSRWRLEDAGPWLSAIAERLACNRQELASLLERYAAAPLGHISGGSDRHGRPFFTFYYEVGALI